MGAGPIPSSGLSPRLRLAAAGYRFRESLFQFPALIVLGGLVLAEVAALVDEAVGGERLPFTVTMNSNAATWLLSTVAGATITTAGVVFSMTVVSLQLASSQFSPRVMRSFVRDRLSQLVIGLLVATFVFCVLTLRHIDGDAASAAPSVSMTVALVLVVATVLLIIAHLNHLAGRLQVGEVVRAIFDEGEHTIRDLERQVARERPADRVPETGGSVLTVSATRAGWVTQAPGDAMLYVVPEHAVVRLETRTGAYIHRGEPLATLRLPPGTDEDRVLVDVRAAVEVSDVRTMQQDVDFALRQLVDIGLRALSPAVNDPTTAVEAILRVAGLMRQVLAADLPAAAIEGPGGRYLLRPWSLTHEEYVAHAFDQLRQTAGSQTQVAAALLRALRMLRQYARESDRPEHLPALERQLRMVIDSVRDRDDLHPTDRDRLLAMADDATDPADHSPDLRPGTEAPEHRRP
ncbi:DUF2254 domain-containing protein [Nocardioides sp. TF02-7]|uniref:DUF2254 domain-containing protein n=1 Tax=Nocardioides sp. TF02-7 TaxID=2917724 RepID=UPI001F06BC1A|nr:DUF2254 domain-containing protein [Nocardioides sp. TF02-7]UMG92756.1 DUF2254 domain-containing protein [Nocardioides sp. TF02-7]